MSYQPHYVAAYEGESGLNTYYEPFLIPEKAFTVLEDAYCWRGRIKKRLGVKTLGRLRRVITTVTLTATAGGATFSLADLLSDSALNFRAPAPPIIPEPNAEIQAGTLVVTVGGLTFTDNGLGVLVSSGANTGSINYVSGAIVLNFVPNMGAGTPVVVSFSYYPALPVLGLPTREIPGNIDNDQMLAFDQKYAYQNISGIFSELPSVAVTTWHTPNYSQFFSTNYWFLNGAQYFWTTNFNAGSSSGDPIRYYYGGTWTDFTPAVSTTESMYSCRILIPYKNRLVALNTWEGVTAGGISTAVNISNRCRFSWIGDPTDQTNGWTSIPGHGGFIDAPTTEVIVGAEFIKDVLIVKFERSSWKLVYTGNTQLPFVWQKINTELGAQSTFSLVPFDNGVFAVGNFGITTDDSVSVQRIDTQIPQQVFKINALQHGVRRVSGVRDYVNELVYWSYPDSTSNARLNDLIYPNKVLLYNYINKTYALFNDSFTCFGYYQPPSAASWASTNITWESYNQVWNFINQMALTPLVAAGNQDGYVMILNQESVKNDPTLPLFAINTGSTPIQLTISNHNLKAYSYIKITDVIGSGPDALNGKTYQVGYIDANTISIALYNPITREFDPVSSTGGIYLGGGQVTIVNNINMRTKVFCPTYQTGNQCRVGYMDFLLDQTPAGEVSLDVFVDENNSIAMNDPANSSSVLGSNVLITRPENDSQPIVEFQQYQAKIFHRMFLNSVCQNFMLNFFMSDAQMSNESVYGNDFVLHAMVFYVSPNARLTQ